MHMRSCTLNLTHELSLNFFDQAVNTISSYSRHVINIVDKHVNLPLPEFDDPLESENRKEI